ncbi:oligosaccharide repeat unit polymerase [Ginsengibacter hankyongi]|uniref:Oligosaccharide repeat unit polymerase n=1 Tax=Ginsengibacter hankyongi TaxID=2607284 RepID=A0A5J5II83_9BACT|nr:oligosaccharide repeat unit polymerase [Ginsengibacter hankyongi]KAA9039288.1 oligosaccharide repeat unit polymerase [Ginsengibacter hankyongi]
MINKETDIYSGDNSKKELKNITLFTSGLITYSVSFALCYSQFPIAIFHAGQLVGLALIVVSSISLCKFNIENRYLSIFYVAYLIWLAIIITRGFQTDSTFIKDMLYNARYGLMPYFVPVVLLFTKHSFFYKKIFDAIIILGIFYLIFDVIFIRQLLSSDRDNSTSVSIIEIFTSTLSLSAGFILLTYNYHSIKRILFSLFIVVLSLFFAVIRARRGLIFMCSSMLLCFYLLFTIHSKLKFAIIYISILLAAIGALYLSSIYKIGNRNIFSFVLDRGDEDTRTGVEMYFYDDLKTKDWIIGKGINGQYFCPDIEEEQATNYRNVIETDYLQIILNGGLLSLGLLLLILIPAVCLGLFYSKNMLSKGAAIWILLWIFYLYPARVSTFTLHYILVWISVGICYSKFMRKMSENEMKEFLNPISYLS